MPLGPHLDLPYGALPRLKLDLYLPDASERCQGLVVFVHGGAWRTSSSRDPTLTELPTLMPQDYALAVINYRLSGQADEEPFRWPGHPLDVKAAVEWLVGKGAAGGLLLGDRWQHARERVWFVGHSAGAHIACHFLLQHPELPPFAPELRATFRGFLFSEPIADIDALVDEYPKYQEWFITDAFGPPPYLSASPANPDSPFALPPHPHPLRLVVSHSPSDTLISFRQPTLLYTRLVDLGLNSETVLLADLDLGDHDELLKSSLFGERVRAWVRDPPQTLATEATS